MIQIEEKALNMNAFIIQRRERYIRPRAIAVSITMLNEKMGVSNL